MAIQQEISDARQKIVKDGFDMSIGELIRIYEKKELGNICINHLPMCSSSRCTEKI